MAGDVTMDAQTKPRTAGPTIIDGLEFPFADYPAPGSAVEVADGIYWISTPVPFVGLKQVNLWLLRDGDGWTMIDCSYGGSVQRELIEAVWAKLLGGRPITQLIVTHFHPDHAGGSGWIAEQWGLRPRMSHIEWLTANLAVMNHNTDHVQSRGIFYRRHGLEETLGALDTLVGQGKALYAGISSYPPAQTREAARLLRAMGTPLLIHQPSYSMLNRWIEDEGLLDTVAELGVGVIGFTVLAQGLLTGRYLDGIPAGSRATQKGYGAFDSAWINDEVIGRVRELNALAEQRGQSLAQMALAWSLRDPRMTSLVIGASSTAQLEQNVDALDNLDFTAEELAEIDRIVDFDSGVDEWADARSGKVGSGI